MIVDIAQGKWADIFVGNLGQGHKPHELYIYNELLNQVKRVSSS